MWPDRVSNPGPPTYESGALPIALISTTGQKKSLLGQHKVGYASILSCPLHKGTHFLLLSICFTGQLGPVVQN